MAKTVRSRSTSAAPASRSRPAKVPDVARAAGVSPALVYTFLSGRYYGKDARSGVGIAEPTRERIILACRQVGFLPESPELLTRVYPEKGDTVFLLSTAVAEGIGNSYFSLVMAGAVEALSPSQRQIGFATFDPQVDYLENAEALPAVVREGRANRFILGGPVNYSLIHAIRQRGWEVAYVSRSVELPGVVSVVPDYAHAAQLGIAHLWECGHRHIAVAAEHYFAPDAYNTRELIRGTRLAMEGVGLPFSPDDVLYKAVEGPERNCSVMPRLLARRPRPTALFCFDDWTAQCMLKAAATAGLRVPQDLSVVGCNDDKTAAYLTPALTTVHLPTIEMGRCAVRELERLIAKSQEDPPRCITLPVELIKRETTRAPSATSD